MSSRIHKTVRLSRSRRWQLYIIGIGVWLSGGLWLLFHYFLGKQGDFGPVENPLTPVVAAPAWRVCFCLDRDSRPAVGYAHHSCMAQQSASLVGRRTRRSICCPDRDRISALLHRKRHRSAGHIDCPLGDRPWLTGLPHSSPPPPALRQSNKREHKVQETQVK